MVTLLPSHAAIEAWGSIMTCVWSGRGVNGVEFDRRGRERAGEIPDGGGVGTSRLRNRRRIFRHAEIELTRCLLVAHADQCGGRARLFERIRHDEADGLMIVLDLRTAEQGCDGKLALAELARVLGGHDSQYAGGSLGRSQVHGRDPALGDARGNDVTISRIWDYVVSLVSVGRGARRLHRAVDAVVRLADNL